MFEAIRTQLCDPARGVNLWVDSKSIKFTIPSFYIPSDHTFLWFGFIAIPASMAIFKAKSIYFKRNK